jgi:cytochrome P450
MTVSEASPAAGPFTITDPAFYVSPFPDYEWMLKEQRIWRDEATGFWVITRYDEVRAILMNPRLWSSQTFQIFERKSTVTDEVRAIYEADGWLPLDTLVSADPPVHKRYRTLVDKAFAPARVKRIQGVIDSMVGPLTERLVEMRRCDFVQEFAIPLTISMIGNQVGGANAEDIPLLRRWTELQIEQINPVLSPEREIELTHETVSFQRWIAAAIDRVRAAPDDTILSGLVRAEVDGETLNSRELIAIAMQFFAAGHDTTTSALASCMLHLALRPDVLQDLKASPKKIVNFVEEILRIEAPVQRLFRRATQDTTIGEVTVREGEIVVVQFGGGNRDSRKFACPADVNIDRDNLSGHLSFGAGIHFCVGNQLARAELRSAVSEIVKRCGTIALAAGDQSIEYHKQFISRAISRLDVEITPA